MTLLKKKVREEKMKREVIDVTLPGKTHEKGHRHPNQIALEDLERVFIGMGIRSCRRTRSRIQINNNFEE